MSNEKIAAAFVAGAILMAVALVAAGATATDSGEDEFVRVTADASTEAEADAAEVVLAVEARAADPSAARRDVADGVSSVRDALTGMNLSEEDVRSTDYTIREERSPSEDREEPLHLARHELTVSVDDVDRAGEVIDAAVDAGATSVSDVRFTLSQERRDELKDEALAQAMNRSRSRAETVAEAGGVSLGEVRSVSTADTDVSPVRMSASYLESEDAAGTSVDPGPVEVRANVEVVYETR